MRSRNWSSTLVERKAGMAEAGGAGRSDLRKPALTGVVNATSSKGGETPLAGGANPGHSHDRGHAASAGRTVLDAITVNWLQSQHSYGLQTDPATGVGETGARVRARYCRPKSTLN